METSDKNVYILRKQLKQTKHCASAVCLKMCKLSFRLCSLKMSYAPETCFCCCCFLEQRRNSVSFGF